MNCSDEKLRLKNKTLSESQHKKRRIQNNDSGSFFPCYISDKLLRKLSKNNIESLNRYHVIEKDSLHSLIQENISSNIL